MSWEAIVAAILKFLPTLVGWIIDLVKGIKNKPAFAFAADATADHGAQVLDVLIATLQAERAKLAPLAVEA